MELRISSRSSALAKIQAYAVGEALLKKNSNLKIKYLFRESLGDKNLTDPLWKMPEKGVFTEDFFKDLVDESTDLVIHSWKDLPIEDKAETAVVATLPRADQRDLLLFKKSSIKKPNLNIYSSSPRREFNLTPFLKKSLPASPESISFVPVRGNIQTRIKKLIEAADIDGLVIAKAALDRLLDAKGAEFVDVQAEILNYLKLLNWQLLPLSENPTAAAQGAIAIEIKKNRKDILDLLSSINDPLTFELVQTERNEFKKLGGGCHQKIGYSIIQHQLLNCRISYLKGLSKNEEILEQTKTHHFSKFTFQADEVMDSRDLWSQINRTPLPIDAIDLKLEFKAVLVAKHSAWENSEWPQPKILWSAGIKTWFQLAQQGYWVNGTLDSLGESYIPKKSFDGDDIDSWLKLTHEDVVPNEFIKTAATYKISRKLKDNIDFSNIKLIHWRSASECLHVIKQKPEVLKINWASGMGQTAQDLLQIKNRNNEVLFFSSEEEWRKNVTSR